MALVSKSADSSSEGVDSGLTFVESNEIAKFVQKMGAEVSPSETDAIEEMLKAKDPSSYPLKPTKGIVHKWRHAYLAIVDPFTPLTSFYVQKSCDFW